MHPYIFNRNILESAVLGFEFEMYSHLPITAIAKELSDELGVIIRTSNKYHSKLRVDQFVWKIEKDFSGGQNMLELITGPMPYSQAIYCLIKILNWIKINAWTDSKCAFQFNLSFDYFKENLPQIQTLDKLKFCLDFNEELFWKSFPDRRNSIYAKSIKQIIPINYFIDSDINSIQPENYIIPSTKYYGVNFKKLIRRKNSYLEFRYIGGSEYPSKSIDIINLINYSINFTATCLLTGYKYSELDLINLQSILNEFTNKSKSIKNFDIFKIEYPKFNVFVDLKSHSEIIKGYWNIIRDRIINLVLFHGVEECSFNYDTDLSRFQLKDASIKNNHTITDFELINCDLTSIVEKCYLYNCQLTKSQIINSYAFDENVFTDCKIKNVPLMSSSILKKCYIENGQYIINGTLDNCVIRSGFIAPEAKLNNSIEIKSSNGDKK